MAISTRKKGGKSAKFVSEFSGVTPRQLRYWTKLGLINSSASPGRKGQEELRFNTRDIITILVIKGLRDKGISLQKIRETVARVRTIWRKEYPLSQLRVACLTQSVVFKKDGVYIDGLSGQQVIESALEKISIHLESRRYGQAKRLASEEGEIFLRKVSKM